MQPPYQPPPNQPEQPVPPPYPYQAAQPYQQPPTYPPPASYPPPAAYPPPPSYQTVTPPKTKRGLPGWAWAMIGAFVLLIAAGITIAIIAPNSNKPNPVGASSAAWKEFKQENGKFSVQMPGTPSEVTQSVDTAAGKVDLYFYQLQTFVSGSPVFYAVGYSDYDAALVKQSSPDAILEGAQNGAVTNVNGKLLSQKSITLDGNPGREIEVEAAGGVGYYKARIFLASNRLYQVLISGAKDKLSAADVQKFFDSFKLTK